MENVSSLSLRRLGVVSALIALVASLLVVAPLDAEQTAQATTPYTCSIGGDNRYDRFQFENDYLSFGRQNTSTSDSSLTAYGMLLEPWVKDGSKWWPVGNTSSSDAGFGASFGVGDSGQTWPDSRAWDLNDKRYSMTPDQDISGSLSGNVNTVVDASGFVETSVGSTRCVGYGELKTTTVWKHGDSSFRDHPDRVLLTVEHTFVLGQSSRYVSVTTRITNDQGSANLENVQFWVGDNEPEVGQDADPDTQRGNISSSGFTKIDASADSSNAVMVTKSSDGNNPQGRNGLGGLIYSADPGVRTSISTGGFSTAVTTNPSTASVELAFSNGVASHAVFVPLGDLDQNDSAEFSWYFAAVDDATIATISQALINDSITVADAPTITSVTAGNGQLTVAFTPGSDGGSAITDYEYSTTGTNDADFVSAGVTSSPVTITGLTNGTAYTVWLRAVNAAGESAESVSSSGTPVAPTPPPADPSPSPSPAPAPAPEPDPAPAPAPRPAAVPTPPAEPPVVSTPARPSTPPAPTPPPAADPAPEAPAGPGAVFLRAEEIFEGTITLGNDTEELIMPAFVLQDIATQLAPDGAPLEEGALVIESGATMIAVLIIQLGDVRLSAADMGNAIQFTLNIPGFESSSMTVAVQKQALVWAFWIQMSLLGVSAAIAMAMVWLFVARNRRRKNDGGPSGQRMNLTPPPPPMRPAAALGI